MGDYFLIGGLADVVTVLPEQVAALAKAIVGKAGRALGDLRPRWASDAHELIHVSLALQRLGGRWRAEGLTVFEELLRAEAQGVDDVLTDLDGPRRAEIMPQPRRLRRRRR